MTQGAPPSQHVESGDLAGRAPLVDFQQLADADRQGQALPSGGVLQASVELAAVERRDRARVQTQPAAPTWPALPSGYCEKLGK